MAFLRITQIMFLVELTKYWFLFPNNDKKGNKSVLVHFLKMSIQNTTIISFVPFIILNFFTNHSLCPSDLVIVTTNEKVSYLNLATFHCTCAEHNWLLSEVHKRGLPTKRIYGF